MSSIHAKPSAPGKYSGTRSMLELDNWAFAITQYLNLVTMEEDKKVLLLSTFLIGEALLWFRTFTMGFVLTDTETITWNNVLLQLRAYFTPPNIHDTLMDEWVALRQKTTVSNYVADIRALQLQIPDLTHAQILDKFVRGLRQKTKIEIKLRAPRTFEEAIELADRYDRIVYGTPDTMERTFIPQQIGHFHRRTPGGQGRFQFQKPSNNFHTDPDAMQLDAARVRDKRFNKTPNNKSIDYSNVTCWNCNQKGHFSSKCPQPKKALKDSRQ